MAGCKGKASGKNRQTQADALERLQGPELAMPACRRLSQPFYVHIIAGCRHVAKAKGHKRTTVNVSTFRRSFLTR